MFQIPKTAFILPAAMFAVTIANGAPSTGNTIESITVFPDRATVTRVVETRIEAGSDEIVQADLPSELSRDSLRVSAQGPEGLRLGGYRLETVRGSERVSQRARDIENRLQELRDRRAGIEDARQAHQMQLNLLNSLAEGAGRGDEKLAMENWQAAMATIGRGADEVLTERRQLQLQIRDIDRDIERLERELEDLGQRQRDTLELRLAYEAASAGQATFRIEYTVSSAAWRPVYEWRLDTESGTLDIEQFAEVRQRTGEDWQNAELSLSLTQPAVGGQLREPEIWRVGVVEPRPEALRPMRAVPEAADAEAPAPDAARPDARPEAEWDVAVLTGTDYTQSYRVPGKATVAADNQPHRFRLDEHSVEVTLSARTVPRNKPAAWLYAEGVYEGEAALPPGPTTLYQDQTLIGEARFAGLAPGGELASSFGMDERIEVEREQIEDKRTTEGMIRKSTQLTRSHRITVRNGHSRPVELTILDAMPVSRDERIEVSMTEDATNPDERDVDHRPGVLAWYRTVPAGEKITLTTGYRLTFPENLEGVDGW